jgi:hypothetical protein
MSARARRDRLLRMTEPLGHRVPVPPAGEYAAIDVARQNAALAALHGPAPAGTVAAVLAAPHAYSPPVLAAVAAVLFADGRRGDSAFWFYAAQLRARFDANRCADPTAAGAVTVLTQHYGPEINRHAFADPARLRATVERVVAWDRATPHGYDHRWINLHGMGAFTGAVPLSRPAPDWPEIAERTREEYLRGLDAALGGQ